ncbi:hypothetical protein BGZ63DRAFT_436071 [Mariannaea sp. PMI_226]|nr:hypothetical protein BGZ63DRAFT_436071 [Mariannaea sp. PMI_226]
MGHRPHFCNRKRTSPIKYGLLAPGSCDDLWQDQYHLQRFQSRVPRAQRGMVSSWCSVVFGAVVVTWTANTTHNVAIWLETLAPLVSPLMCHSHNDYRQSYPLFSALAVGCASVEADVWLSQDGRDLLIGHDRQFLSSSKTLWSLYLDPISQILNSMNPSTLQNGSNSTTQARGVFAKQPSTTLILFIDVKDDPVNTWPLVLEHLKPLNDRKYLSRHERIQTMTTNQTFWPGPVTIVGTGNILNRRDINQHHHTFLDAPLNLLTETGFCDGNGASCDEERENEFYTTSASFKEAIGSVRTGFSEPQLTTLRNQIQVARKRNLKSRYWGLPHWPISYRDYVWDILAREGVDLLNADDVVSVATKHWNRGYIRETIFLCFRMKGDGSTGSDSPQAVSYLYSDKDGR